MNILRQFEINTMYWSSVKNSDQTKLIIPYFRTTVQIYSLAYQGYQTWNAIPCLIKQLTNTKLFTKKYKEHLLLEIPE